MDNKFKDIIKAMASKANNEEENQEPSPYGDLFAGSPYQSRPWDTPSISDMISGLEQQKNPAMSSEDILNLLVPRQEKVDYSKLMSAGKPSEITAAIPTEKPKSQAFQPKDKEVAQEIKAEEKQQVKEEPQTQDEYDAAKAAEMDRLRGLALVAGFEKVGQAISQSYGPGIDYGMLETLAKKPAADILAKREEAAKKLERKSAAQEMADKEAYKDPNSATSENTRMLTKELLKTAGLPNISEKISTMSAYEIDKKFPYLSNLISAKQAQDARAVQAAMAKAVKEEGKLDKQRFREEDWLTNQLEKEAKSPELKRIERLDADAKNIQRSIANPGGIGEIAVLYGFLKSIDENSAVREGEVKLGLEAMNAMEKVKSWSSNFSSKKKVLPPSILKDIQIINESAQQGAREAYDRRMQHVYSQGLDRGIPKERLNRSIGLFVDKEPAEATPRKEQPKATTNTAEAKSAKTVVKKQYSPSANKTKLTYSDGTEEILDGRQ